MTHLIIVAHPSSDSFSIFLAKELEKHFNSIDWNTIVRDLYKIDFQPVLSYKDLSELKSGRVPEDILNEQQFIRQADLISVIYPLWWASFPAILKGYIDKVFSNGFAFNYGKDGASGLLKGKQVIIHTTMGNTIEEYKEKGLIEAFKMIHGKEVFAYSGMEIIKHNFYPQITLADKAKRNYYLNKALMAYSELHLKMQ